MSSSKATPPDYTLLHRSITSVGDLRSKYDIMITAFDGSDRARVVLGSGAAAEVVCGILPHYGFSISEVDGLQAEYPTTSLVRASTHDEADLAALLLARPGLGSAKICLDLSGLPRTHLVHLVLRLLAINPGGFDAVYVEPSHYVHEDETRFAEGQVEVRPIRGFEGVNRPTRDEVLLIGTGFEVDLMNMVAQEHPRAHKLQLFGLPSLQPEMYQQNVLQTMLATEAVEGSGVTDRFFAPAYCPYETACAIQRALSAAKRRGSNLYLAPLGTKAQALGFALYYLNECKGQRATMLGVDSTRLQRKAAIGVNRIWRYEIRML